jgi:hypothetical protein
MASARSQYFQPFSPKNPKMVIKHSRNPPLKLMMFPESRDFFGIFATLPEANPIDPVASTGEGHMFPYSKLARPCKSH